MNWLMTLGEAWRALGSNKLRTALTMLGMIIGVAAVVLMLAIGGGVEASVNRQVASMGSNLFIILSGSASTGAVRLGSGNAPTLTLGDADALTNLPGVRMVAPTFPGGAQLVYGINNWNTQVLGVTPEYLDVRDWPLEDGDPIIDTDVRSAARVALLGRTVADKLFNDENPVGKTLRIRGQPFIVAGVLSRKGQSLDGRDQDDSVLVPITTAQSKLFGNRFPGTVRFIMVQAASAQAMNELEQDMAGLLRQRHRLQPDADDDFTIRNLTQLAETASGVARALALMLGAIGSISLIVGGIGIMNIMLVSVTERTREIGIRMAIGAKKRDILLQFLLESLMISVVGGAVGVVIGIGGAVATGMALNQEITLSAYVMLLAFGVAAAVGIFFGFYPAKRAANLRPVEALRYE